MLCLAGSAFAAQQPEASANNAAGSTSGSVVTLAGHTARPVLDGTAIRIGHYDPEQKLRLALGVQVPHMAEEETLLRALQTKGDPNFHKFLSAKQWNARFAPAAEDEQKVVDWATSQGLTITHRFDNRLLVDVEAPAGVIERAFNVTLNQYQYGDEVDFANDRDPQIPATLSGILQSVAGLNSIERFYRVSSSRARTKGPDYVAGPVYSQGQSAMGEGDPTKAPTASPATETGLQPSFTNGIADPADIPYSSQSYNYSALFAQGHCCNPHGDKSGSPPDSSIAVMTFGNFENSDVQGFFHTYGMAYNYKSFFIDGTSYPGQDDEAPLDVEYAGGTANSFGSPNDTARVFVYEATNTQYSTYEDTFNFIASDDFAKVVTTSYGWAEEGFLNGNDPSIFVTMHGIFNTMAGQGFTLISAAGDNGATDDCSDSDQVHYPAADADFLAAGGTQIHFYSNGTFASEVDWTGIQTFYNCSGNHGGGGGGVSRYQSAPYWQSFLHNSKRTLPDISLNANTSQNYFYQGSLRGVGGTSIVAPELAGFFAQENAYLAAIGSICGSGSSPCEPLGNVAPILYEEANDQNAAHFPFYDVTEGCNSNYYTTHYSLSYFCAGPGYDPATGWGSMNALQLAWAINWEVIPASGIPYITWSGPATNKWYNTNQTVSWTIHDFVPSGGTPGTGIAGETQGWDSIPADPSREAGPGTGNSFYNGPQFPNGASGCLAFEPNGCSGGVSQGCHYARARGWNNQGFSTANQSSYPESYGPLCYDTVAPSVAVSFTPSTPTSGWYNKLPVTVTLAATDPGGTGASGIAHVYYGFNSATCNTGALSGCSSYGSPLVFNTQGVSSLFSFAEDRAGNFSTLGLHPVLIDTTAPVTTTGLSGTLGTGATYFTSAVTVVLKATDNLSGVQATYYSLDGAAQTIYGGPFVIAAPGSHTLAVHSVDVAGNVEQTSTRNLTIESPTSTTLASSLNPSLSGQSVTLTAHVVASLSGTPAGTVTFKDGTTVLGTGTLAGGAASLTTNKLTPGTHSLTAYYEATANDLSSTSAVLTQTVHQTTTTTLSSSASSLAFGSPVTLTATVKASLSGTPSGPVVFYDGATSLGSVNLNTSGVAVLTTTKLLEGNNAVYAAYGGSTEDAASNSPTVHIEVTAAATSMTLTASTTKDTYGASVTFTATVTSAGGEPSGAVTFLANGNKLGSIDITSGAGSFSSAGLPAGDNSIVAEYAGDADF